MRREHSAQRKRQIHGDMSHAWHAYSSYDDLYATQRFRAETHRCCRLQCSGQVSQELCALQSVVIKLKIPGSRREFHGLNRQQLEHMGVNAATVLHARNQQPSADVQALLAGLKACSRTENLQRGKQLHAEAAKCGHDSSVYVANALINMYSKCGRMQEAQRVFGDLQQPGVVSWTALILGYADDGQAYTALKLFLEMRNGGPAANAVTFLAALKACTALLEENGEYTKCRNWGKEIHNLAMEARCDSDLSLQNTLIDMYSKCGDVLQARQMFDCIQNPDVVSWTALILGYADNGQGLASLDLFKRMKCEGFAPNSITIVTALKACTSLAVKHGNRAECRRRGEGVHNLSIENGCSSDTKVQNTLIDMYAKCGSMAEARQLFNDLKHPTVVSWTVLLIGYADNGQGLLALDLFRKMRSEGLAPNPITFLAVLKTCTFEACEECRHRVKLVHNLAIENGYNTDLYVESTLLDMYAKCGSMLDARQVFDSMKHPDVVSWTSLISGYADNGQGLTSLYLFRRMKRKGPVPNSVTCLVVLKACAQVGALELGRSIHSEMDSPNLVWVNCLVDFYAKCGNLVEARNVFDMRSETRDVITWNALLAGYSSCGDKETAFALFKEMQEAGYRPDGITLLSILLCCCHMGLVENGKECFDEMPTKHGVTPGIEHYTCMVDLFGRANKLDDAMALLQCMTCRVDFVIWITILSACRKWKNVEIGRLAFQCLIELNASDSSPFMLMEQIYGSLGMLEEQKLVMGMRRELRADWKNPAKTFWTNEAGSVHAFMVEDTSSPHVGSMEHLLCAS